MELQQAVDTAQNQSLFSIFLFCIHHLPAKLANQYYASWLNG